MPQKKMAEYAAQARARRRALGMRSTEAVLYQREIAILDDIKDRLGLASRSDAIRVLIARTDPAAITPVDVAKLEQSAA